MFDALTNRLHSIFGAFRKTKTLTEEDLSQAIREMRLALLEADVNYQVAKQFVARVKEKAKQQEILRSVTAEQQFTKILYDELLAIMGREEAQLSLSSSPAKILLCGLQGAGKTTHAMKLARFLQKKPYNKRPLLVACDLQRPAAIEQLRLLGERIAVPVFFLPEETCPLTVSKRALEHAKKEKCDVLIFDTAGRTHIDEELMKELSQLKTLLSPDEILFIANAMLGQDAVKSADLFHQTVGITGTILSMLDGNARGGAALSIYEVTKQPLKFEGIGEGPDDFRLFHPASMADRILGRGDVINLVKKAEEHLDKEKAEKLTSRFFKADFCYEDFLSMILMIQKMGPLRSLLKMIPGVKQMPNMEEVEPLIKQVKSMILSMTPRERASDHIDMGRRRRIAQGSGIPLTDVNQIIKRFTDMKRLLKQTPLMKQMQQMMQRF